MTTALKQPNGLLSSLTQLIKKRTTVDKRDQAPATVVSQKLHANGRAENAGTLHRQSEAWRTGIGPGYVTGVTQSVLDLISDKPIR